MPTSDDQLQKKRDTVADLRQQLAAREAEVVRLQREKENDVTAERLETEAQNLKAQISARDEEIKVLGGDPSKIKVNKSAPNTGAEEALAAATTPTTPEGTAAPANNETKKEG